MKKNLVIWGASGHARVVADIIRLRGEYEIVGYLDDLSPAQPSRLFCGLPVFGGKRELENVKGLGVDHVIFGFGNCGARLRLAELVREMGFSLATAIHPRSIIAEDVFIGPGTVIAAGAAVNPGSRIGENVIINTCSSVDHEVIVDDGAHICPGAVLGGNVRVGRGAWVGIGATVKDHITIGSGAFIGAGSVVIRDIPGDVVAHGVPARVIRAKEERN